MFRCNQLDKFGKPCLVTCTRKSNLKRHTERKHAGTYDRFVHYVYNHGNDAKCSEFPRRSIGSPILSGARTASPIFNQSNNVHPHPVFQSQVDEVITPPSAAAPNGVSGLGLVQPQIHLKDTPGLTEQSHMTDGIFDSSLERYIDGDASDCGDDTSNPTTTNTALAIADSPVQSSNMENPASPSESQIAQLIPRAPWETRRNRIRKRLHESLEKEELPVYQVKRSRRWPNQQRAVGWITQHGKAHFDMYYANLLGQWGVKPAHQSTCILLPADWAALDPVRLAALFDISKCPRMWADGLPFQYEDHITSLTRAVAWFADSDWPRNGQDLDNFLGCGPYKSKQGSHLCHHNLCIVHLTYESPDDNEDRKQCYARAKFLRQENLKVSEHCHKHDPPCLMKLAVLTMAELLLIQFTILRQARDLPPITPPLQPRWHTYPTFETQLPLTFAQEGTAIVLEDDKIEVSKGKALVTQKPELVCSFCLGIKCFKGLIAFWSHLVHQHYQTTTTNPYLKVLIDEGDLLEAVRLTANLWRDYWAHSDGGKRRDPTMAKLLQVEEPTFTWANVLEWKLR